MSKESIASIIPMNTNNYDYDTLDGENVAIDKETGEVLGTVTALIPRGSQIITPKIRKRIRDKNEAATRKARKKSENAPLGSFVFIRSDGLNSISAESAARLVFLSTFLKFDGGALRRNNRPILRSELPKLLGLSKSTVSRFVREVSPTYLSINSENEISLCESIAFRGALKAGNYEYRKAFNRGVRAVYMAADINQHKQLGYIFQMLPFVNVEYNLLCRNPLETNIAEIDLLTVKDFCEIIGYDVAHWSDLLAKLRKITFTVKTRQEQFCRFVYDGSHTSKAVIVVNPNVLYSGSNFQKVEMAQAYFRK